MFAPEARQAGENPFTYAALAALFILGGFLTFKAWRPARNPGAPA
jgi:hypothetical protein